MILGKEELASTGTVSSQGSKSFRVKEITVFFKVTD
jgi:hypothetical protein